MLPSTPPCSSIRDKIYPPPTHRRQLASSPHPVPLAALFFQNRSTQGNKKESFHYAHPTLQPFLTNLIPPAFLPLPLPPFSFLPSYCFSLHFLLFLSSSSPAKSYSDVLTNGRIYRLTLWKNIRSWWRMLVKSKRSNGEKSTKVGGERNNGSHSILVAKCAH